MSGFIQKSIALGFEFMFTRSLFETADMQAQHDILNEVSRLLDASVLECILTESFGLLTPENLRRVHARVESRAMIGRLAPARPASSPGCIQASEPTAANLPTDVGARNPRGGELSPTILNLHT